MLHVDENVTLPPKLGDFRPSKGIDTGMTIIANEAVAWFAHEPLGREAAKHQTLYQHGGAPSSRARNETRQLQGCHTIFASMMRAARSPRDSYSYPDVASRFWCRAYLPAPLETRRFRYRHFCDRQSSRLRYSRRSILEKIRTAGRRSSSPLGRSPSPSVSEFYVARRNFCGSSSEISGNLW